MANHGFLPRNGRNISIPVLNAGCVAGLNVGIDFCTAIGRLGLLSRGALAKGGQVFDLNDLDEHNFPIEHDGAMLVCLFIGGHSLTPRSFAFARGRVFRRQS
jgi:hypothetical protein